jgi:hypothetical protein
MATKPPEEVVKVVNCFIQYIRRNNRREGNWAATMLRSSPPFGKPHSLRKYPNHLIINLDETPLPFEFLNGYSYDFKGVKTVAGKSERSGWDKRQVTIILYIMADGSTPFKPVIIFHGKGTVAEDFDYMTALISATEEPKPSIKTVTLKQLQEECVNRGLAKSGTKPELVARL